LTKDVKDRAMCLWPILLVTTLSLHQEVKITREILLPIFPHFLKKQVGLTKDVKDFGRYQEVKITREISAYFPALSKKTLMTDQCVFGQSFSLLLCLYTRKLKLQETSFRLFFRTFSKTLNYTQYNRFFNVI